MKRFVSFLVVLVMVFAAFIASFGYQKAYAASKISSGLHDAFDSADAFSTTLVHVEVEEFVPTIAGTYTIRIVLNGTTDITEHIGLVVW